MNRSVQFPLLPVLAAVVALCQAGCGSNNQPSYADLVVIYNAELESLDRLERKKEELIAKHDAELRPAAEDALEALGGILNSAVGQDQNNNPRDTVDPNEMLDRAISNAENAQRAASQLLEAASAQSSAKDEQSVPYSEELQRQLATLDEAIEKQRDRVQRAREARDAAEPH